VCLVGLGWVWLVFFLVWFDLVGVDSVVGLGYDGGFQSVLSFVGVWLVLYDVWVGGVGWFLVDYADVLGVGFMWRGVVVLFFGGLLELFLFPWFGWVRGGPVGGVFLWFWGG